MKVTRILTRIPVVRDTHGQDHLHSTTLSYQILCLQIIVRQQSRKLHEISFQRCEARHARCIVCFGSCGIVWTEWLDPGDESFCRSQEVCREELAEHGMVSSSDIPINTSMKYVSPCFAVRILCNIPPPSIDI